MDLFDLAENNGQSIPVSDPNALESDKPRLGGKTLAVLEHLRRGPAHGHDLMASGGTRYGARINDLRKAGYKIDAKHVRDGIWLYSLVE